MRFLIVVPREKRWYYSSCSMETAHKLAGIEQGKVDHGPVIEKEVYIIVYESGLFEPERDDLFCVGRRLYVGGAVLYQVDERGDTVDFSASSLVNWIVFGGRAWAEGMIKRGAIERPAIRVNGEAIWEWPNPRPDKALEEAAQAMAEAVKNGGTAVIGDIAVKKI